MAPIVVQCPNCKAKYRIKNKNLLGPRLQCAKCRTSFRVKSPRKTAAPAVRTWPEHEEIIEDVWVDEDDNDVVEDFQEDGGDSEWISDDLGDMEDSYGGAPALPTPTRQPRRRRPKKSARRDPDDDLDNAGSGTGKTDSKKNTVLMVAGISVFSIGLLAGMIFMVRAAMSGSLASGGDIEAPTEYLDYDPQWKKFTCKYPSDWEFEGGGGQNNVPAFATMSKGKARLEIRVNASQSMILSVEKTSGGMGVQTMPLVEEIHYHQNKLLVDRFRGYQEKKPEPINAYYGDARVSEFTAKTLLGGKLRGYRGTVIGGSVVDQLRILCVCPDAQWATLKPVFRRVIESIASESQKALAERLAFEQQFQEEQEQAQRTREQARDGEVPLDVLGEMDEEGEFEFERFREPEEPQEPVEPADNSEFEKFLKGNRE